MGAYAKKARAERIKHTAPAPLSALRPSGCFCPPWRTNPNMLKVQILKNISLYWIGALIFPGLFMPETRHGRFCPQAGRLQDVSKSNYYLILRRSFAKKRRFWLIFGAYRAAPYYRMTLEAIYEMASNPQSQKRLRALRRKQKLSVPKRANTRNRA